MPFRIAKAALATYRSKQMGPCGGSCETLPGGTYKEKTAQPVTEGTAPPVTCWAPPPRPPTPRALWALLPPCPLPTSLSLSRPHLVVPGAPTPVLSHRQPPHRRWAPTRASAAEFSFSSAPQRVSPLLATPQCLSSPLDQRPKYTARRPRAALSSDPNPRSPPLPLLFPNVTW